MNKSHLSRYVQKICTVRELILVAYVIKTNLWNLYKTTERWKDYAHSYCWYFLPINYLTKFRHWMILLINNLSSYLYYFYDGMIDFYEILSCIFWVFYNYNWVIFTTLLFWLGKMYFLTTGKLSDSRQINEQKAR